MLSRGFSHYGRHLSLLTQASGSKVLRGASLSLLVATVITSVVMIDPSSPFVFALVKEQDTKSVGVGLPSASLHHNLCEEAAMPELAFFTIAHNSIAVNFD